MAPKATTTKRPKPASLDLAQQARAKAQAFRKLAPGNPTELTEKAASKKAAARGSQEASRTSEVQAAARTSRGPTAREKRAGVSDRQGQRGGVPPMSGDMNEGLEPGKLTDEEQDQILLDIEAKHGIEVEDEDPLAKYKSLYEEEDRGDGRDDKGRFATDEEEDDDQAELEDYGEEEEELEEEEEEEDQPKSKKRRDPANEDEVADAIRALRGALGKEAAEALVDKLSDDEILGAAQHAITRERAIQKKLSAAGRQAADGDEGLDSRGDPRAEEPAGKTVPRAQVKSDLAAAAKLISEELVGTEGGEVVSKAFNGLVAQNDQMARALVGNNQLVEDLLQRASRESLKGSYPELMTNDRLFAKVWKKADTLHTAGRGNGEYSDGLAGIDEALMDAARVVMKDRPKARRVSRKAESERQDSKSSGSPAPKRRSRNRTISRTFTQDEFEDRVLVAIEAGNTKEVERLRNHAKRGYVVANPVSEPMTG